MTREKAASIIARLAEMYPDAKPQLEFASPFELLVAVILSAQCTDVRVNMVTKKLFEVANTPEKMLQISQKELESSIYSCGFYKNKAEHILSSCRDIVEKYGGNVPSTIEELTKLAGVGQKTANVVYSVAFGGDAIAVDTHVFRVANRTGLANANNPHKTEAQLKEILERNVWSRAHHYLIFHGRHVCSSQRPKCANCDIADLCEYAAKNL